MGNTICFEIDEFYFKFAYSADKDIENVTNLSKYITWTTVNTENLNSLLGKILFTDINDYLLKDDRELVNIRKFVTDNFLKNNEDDVLEINVTGNGFDIYKEEINTFFSRFLTKYVFNKHKHIRCIVKGSMFFKEITSKNFFYGLDPYSILGLNDIKLEDCTPDKKKYKSIADCKDDIMLVNIRSGVSYYKVDEEGKFERVSGSIIGESTFASLIRLLAGYENCMEALDEGMKGDYRVVDMTVGDIYGGGCADLGLPEDLLASSMGKAQYIKDKDQVEPRDLAKSIMAMFCINIALMTNLVADSEKVKTVIVQGFPHLGFQTFISTAFKVYDKEDKTLLFVDNVEFIGCIGMDLMLKEQNAFSSI